MIKTAIATALSFIVSIAPAASAQDVPQRPFLEFVEGFATRIDPFTSDLDAGAWGDAAEKAQELTMWLLEKGPEECYAYVWGLAVAMSAATAPTMLTSEYTETPGFIPTAEALNMSLGQQNFIAELKKISDELSSTYTMSCM